ncbi:unnamed protein product [Lactuca saligna]|uniref:PI4-kinase N-terminal domain-containing protein n=1 Tax=Lactuca saligna TaxID=75948 RepID=A0AA35YQ89_LACSI|nr:unnamed protein product [Lactuca saligna]
MGLKFLLTKCRNRRESRQSFIPGNMFPGGCTGSLNSGYGFENKCEELLANSPASLLVSGVHFYNRCYGNWHIHMDVISLCCSSAWLWIIDTKRGLFASYTRFSGPAAKLRPTLQPSELESPPEKDPVEQILAHKLWIGFFIDNFEVVRHDSLVQLLLLGRMLQGTTKLPWKFSHHPATVGTFFTVILLGLKFYTCQYEGSLQKVRLGIQLLEDGIYRAALGWFAYEPEWFEHNHGNFPHIEAQSVNSFVRYLQNDPKALGGEYGGSFLDMDHCHPVWGPMENYAACKDKRKQLLLMLCQHEADRLEVWAQPVNYKPHDRVPLKDMKADWHSCLGNKVGFKGFAVPKETQEKVAKFSFHGHEEELRHDSVVIKQYLIMQHVEHSAGDLIHLFQWLLRYDPLERVTTRATLRHPFYTRNNLRNQLIKTDQVSILIRSLLLKQQKKSRTTSKNAKGAGKNEGSRKRDPERAADGRVSAKRACDEITSP